MVGVKVGANVGDRVGDNVDAEQHTLASGSETLGSGPQRSKGKLAGYGPQLKGCGAGQALAVGDMATQVVAGVGEVHIWVQHTIAVGLVGVVGHVTVGGVAG